MEDWTDEDETLVDEALYRADQRERDKFMEAAEREYIRRHPIAMREPPPNDDDVF